MSERIELLNGLGWAELGCWIDGHWGQYGPDRLVSIAVMHGWDVSPDDDELVLMARKTQRCICSTALPQKRKARRSDDNSPFA